VPTGIDNLVLLPSGPLPPNPAELLGSPRMAELIDELKSMADIVFFDTPPVLAVADSTLLARACDATLLIVLADSTKGNMLRKAATQITQAGAHLAGTVLNKVRTSSDGYYYYYHKYYSSTEN
jgi:non-specific protein-tyrosine kinase